MMFFDDRLAMPGIYGGSVAEAVRLGARPVKLDLSIVLGVVAGATERIGLGRDLLHHVLLAVPRRPHLCHAGPPLRGRAAWNIVTSVNDSEAQNYGFNEHLGHDVRYDRADEFLEVTTGLWDTWEDDALVMDRASGYFADPDKVHELGHEGKWFSSRGPLTVPRSPQGRPVLLQAGSSGHGRQFAARWAELIFTGDPDMAIAHAHYQDQKESIEAAGRDPQSVKMLPMVYTVVGESRAQAEEREDLFLHSLVDPKASLDLALRAHELRLLGHGAGRPDHGRAHRFGVGHPRPGAEPADAHRRRHRHAGRSGRPPGHPAPGPSFRRHRHRGGRPDGGVDRGRGLRRIRGRRHPHPWRLRGRRADGGPRVAAPRRVSGALHR